MPKLYMFYLGGNAGRSNIEVHDIQFAVCDDYREAIPALKAAWFGDADKIHIDGWQVIEWVDGYDIDVSDRAACRDVLTADVEAHGAYYGVVLNAGLTRDAAFPAFSDDDWDSVLRTNLDGFYNVLHPVIMPMIRRRQDGRIVCMASVSGITGNRGQVNYSASKAGIIGAAKALAVELAKRKITVNCVAPGLIDTEIVDENVPVDEILKAVPAARMGTPEEVAHAVRFLMDEKAAYITRQVIAVNGGLC